MTFRSANRDLPPLPSDDEILAALAALEDERPRDFGITANRLAGRLGIVGARRLGRGAQGRRSWTGTMSPSLRLAPRLRSLRLQGLVEIIWTSSPEYRNVYLCTAAGRIRAAAQR